MVPNVFRLIVLVACVLYLDEWLVYAQTDQQQSAISKELEALFKADQADQADPGPKMRTKWELLSSEEREAIIKHREPQIARDRERRARVLEIVHSEKLQSSNDYFYSAQILQHGEKAEDFLLAHILSTVAAYKGHPWGKWMSAASLDRFLLQIGRAQIFGTNYYCDKNCPVQTQDPYEKVLSDAVLLEYCVPSLTEQIQNLDFFNKHVGQFHRRAAECERDGLAYGEK